MENSEMTQMLQYSSSKCCRKEIMSFFSSCYNEEDREFVM